MLDHVDLRHTSQGLQRKCRTLALCERFIRKPANIQCPLCLLAAMTAAFGHFNNLQGRCKVQHGFCMEVSVLHHSAVQQFLVGLAAAWHSDAAATAAGNIATSVLRVAQLSTDEQLSQVA